MAQAWQNDLSTIALDNHDLLSALILDLYNAEIIGVGQNYKSSNIDLITNKTTTSTTFVTMAGSGFFYTPNKPNLFIRCSNLILLNSGNFDTEAIIAFGSYTPTDSSIAHNVGTVSRELSLAAEFRGVTIGTLTQVELKWRVSGGTGTANANAWLFFEIEEYD